MDDKEKKEEEAKIEEIKKAEEKGDFAVKEESEVITNEEDDKSKQDGSVEDKKEDTKSEEVEPKDVKKKRSGGWKLKLIIFTILGLIFLCMCSSAYAVTTSILRVKNKVEVGFEKTVDAPKEELILNLPQADVKIVGTNDNEIIFDLSGPDYLIDGLVLNDGRGKYTLKYSDIYAPIIGIIGKGGEITGTISIPRNTTLEVNTIGKSEIKVDNIDAIFRTTIAGDSRLDIVDSVVQDLEVESVGATKISVDECRGELKIEIVGEGSFYADRCEVTELDLDITGAGDVYIDKGAIEDANINITGPATVEIPKVRGNLKQDTDGTASVVFR